MCASYNSTSPLRLAHSGYHIEQPSFELHQNPVSSRNKGQIMIVVKKQNNNNKTYIER